MVPYFLSGARQPERLHLRCRFGKALLVCHSGGSWGGDDRPCPSNLVGGMPDFVTVQPHGTLGKQERSINHLGTGKHTNDTKV